MTEQEKLKIAINALELIEKYWDISDVSNVRPAIEIKSFLMEVRNDSMAAGAIISAIFDLNKIRGSM